MKTTSQIELSKSALENNFNFIKEHLPQRTTFSAVVKGNAYGHGIEDYTPLAQAVGINHFSTFSADEAFRLFNSINPENAQIMIMGNVFEEQLEWIIKNDIEFFTFNYLVLNNAIEIANKLKIKAKIHLEFETGMNRTGFNISDFNKIINIFNNNDYLELKGVCTHLAGAESISNYKRVTNQLKRFKKLRSKFDQQVKFNPIFHSLCSAGFLSYPRYKADLVRLGILQYGFFPSPETYIQFVTKHRIQKNPLKRVISWKSRVMDLKKVKIGEFIGYGTTYLTNEPTKIAIVPIGYSNGFTRYLSNNGKVLIRGQRHSVVGTVNMNMIAVNVSSLTNIEIGDEVVIIGRQDDAELTVASFSEISNIVNYELLTRLPSEINRTIVD